MTFGTAARRSTAAVGRNLGDMGDRGIILLLMTYDLRTKKISGLGESILVFEGRFTPRRSIEIVDLRNMADAEDSYA